MKSSDQPPASRPVHPLYLEGADIRTLIVLTMLYLGWLGVWQWNRILVETEDSGASSPRIYRVDLNHATWQELTVLDRIGERMAKRIVDDRDRYGPFVSVEDVERVSGIGPKTIEVWSDTVFVSVE